MRTLKSFVSSESRYSLKEGRNWGKFNNATRVIAASEVLKGRHVSSVAEEYGASVCSIRNWVKTLAKNNPHL